MVIGTIALIAVQVLLIAALLAVRAGQRRARSVLQAGEAALRARDERVRRLVGRLIDSRDALCGRLARDLHDNVCQELAGLSLAMSELKRRRGDLRDAAVQEAVTALQRRTLAVVETVRRLANDLHPSMLRHIGLVAALEALCIEVEQRYDVQVSFDTECDLQRVGDQAGMCLFRVAQEALRNAAVHGNARRILVSIAASDEYVELTVVDNGTGFDVDLAHRRDNGLGLDSMEERALRIGGHLHVVSRPGDGTTVQAFIPPGVMAAEEGPLAQSA